MSGRKRKSPPAKSAPSSPTPTPTPLQDSPRMRAKRSKSTSPKRSPDHRQGNASSTKKQQPGYSADLPVRVYCDGIYDLFHFGHARALEQAKKSFPYVCLLVGVCNDQLTMEKKGKVVMTGAERAESLRHCKWVDQVIENAPWVIDQEFLDRHQIDYVAHDDIPYASGGIDDVYAFVKKQGKFLPTKRTEGVSTSDLITRIVRDYDQYVRRNLERGVPAKELNVGFLKEKELQVKKQVEDLKGIIRSRIREGEGYIKQNWSESKNELFQSVDKWEERSGELLRGFLSLFDRDGPMKKLFRNNNNSPVNIFSGAAGSSSSGSAAGRKSPAPLVAKK